MSEAQVKERLRKIRSGAQLGNIQLKDVEEALSDEALLTADGLLTANENGVRVHVPIYRIEFITTNCSSIEICLIDLSVQPPLNKLLG